MKPNRVVVALVIALALVVGFSLDARAGGAGDGRDPHSLCFVDQPIGNPLNGMVALDISGGYDPFAPGGGSLVGDVDVTVSLERSGNQHFFRLFIPSQLLAIPANVVCDILQAAYGAPTLTLEKVILSAFGFPTDYRIVISNGSISDTDFAQYIPGTGSPGRFSLVATVRLYATKK